MIDVRSQHETSSIQISLIAELLVHSSRFAQRSGSIIQVLAIFKPMNLSACHCNYYSCEVKLSFFIKMYSIIRLESHTEGATLLNYSSSLRIGEAPTHFAVARHLVVVITHTLEITQRSTGEPCLAMEKYHYYWGGRTCCIARDRVFDRKDDRGIHTCPANERGSEITDT